jgi:hypothetical protein
VEVFDPASGKFLMAAAQMNDSRHFMSETRLRDGSVLLAGGYPNNDQVTAQTWIYRPQKRRREGNLPPVRLAAPLVSG